ncbi:MAG: deoxyribose-phosphate aldolase [Bacteroidales bacterium]|nr:deoxyribose-phosphate aldolase [Bacteroidales bacterium]
MTPDTLSAETYNSLRQVFSCIDNTTLEGSDTHSRVEQLCRRSMELVDADRGIGPVAAVCVYPVFVHQAKTLLQGSGIRVASVAAAFPAGQSPLSVKLAEVRYAVDQGADEIDMVISRGSLIEGDYNKVFDEIAAIRQETQGLTLKAILETGELPTADFIAKASQIAIDAGVDFIKTSTGKIAVSATPEAAEVMLNIIKKHHETTGRWVGFKAAGGISTPEEVLKYYNLALQLLGKEQINNQFFRIGASRLTERLFAFLTEQKFVI